MEQPGSEQRQSISTHSITLNTHYHNSAKNLDSVLFRVGLLAALRSMKLDAKVVGVMITASHNQESVSNKIPNENIIINH